VVKTDRKIDSQRGAVLMKLATAMGTVDAHSLKERLQMGKRHVDYLLKNIDTCITENPNSECFLSDEYAPIGCVNKKKTYKKTET
jgi:hypothetical protein